jgi:uncharacterized protein YbjT (DUF2867 family)
MDLKYAGEQHLRKSGQAYTIVRPCHLLDGPLHKGIPRIGQTNALLRGIMKGITRADLAAVCVAAALSPDCENTTFEVACDAVSAGKDPSTEVPAFDPEAFKKLSQGWESIFM